MSLSRAFKRSAGFAVAPDYSQYTDRARGEEARSSRDRERDLFYVNKANDKIRSKVPAGLHFRNFKVRTPLGKEDTGKERGAVRRRNALLMMTPRLDRAVRLRDIFSYNDSFNKLKGIISRSTGGRRFVKEMPDPEEIRRDSRLKRRPMGSREQTLGLSF